MRGNERTLMMPLLCIQPGMAGSRLAPPLRSLERPDEIERIVALHLVGRRHTGIVGDAAVLLLDYVEISVVDRVARGRMTRRARGAALERGFDLRVGEQQRLPGRIDELPLRSHP